MFLSISRSGERSQDIFLKEPHVNETSDPPEFLRKLSLEVISNIPDDAFIIYTDGNRNENSRSLAVGDNTGVDILDKLKRISSSREVRLQWVPLHVNIVGNEIADTLAKDGTAQLTINSAPLTYSELHSTYINNKQSTVPPAHHWYERETLSLQCSRQKQTILTCFRSGHL
ncbi:UNVERIFIED_CONTAM: hypothetical protein NCL1_16906 [Trichonephila clavipes]